MPRPKFDADNSYFELGRKRVIAVNVASIVNERSSSPMPKSSTPYILVLTRSCLYIIILYSHPTALRSFDVCIYLSFWTV